MCENETLLKNKLIEPDEDKDKDLPKDKDKDKTSTENKDKDCTEDKDKGKTSAEDKDKDKDKTSTEDKDNTTTKTKTSTEDKDKTTTKIRDKTKDRLDKTNKKIDAINKSNNLLAKLKAEVTKKIELVYEVMSELQDEIYSDDSCLRLVELNKIDAIIDEALNSVWKMFYGKNRINPEMIKIDKHKGID